MTFNEIMILLGQINIIYPNEKPGGKEEMAVRAKLWQEDLCDVSAELVEMAFRQYRKTNTSGFAPKPAHLLNIIRCVFGKSLDDGEITCLLKRALSNSAFNSQAEFDRLPDDLKKVVGNAGELYYQSQRSLTDTDFYIKGIIKEYKIRLESGMLDNSLLVAAEGNIQIGNNAEKLTTIDKP
ncbi:MAG: hypothetical protein IKN39_01790 [Clostridia bacterium]|nr:hypothetical protein [Clostridia bacterium]